MRYWPPAPFLGPSQGLYSVHARDFIASTTAAGFRWRMYRSVVATDECPNWALNDVQRRPFAGKLEGVGVPQGRGR